jgi:uncharacterized protein (DUF58 family)
MIHAFYTSLFFSRRFYWLLVAVILVFVLSYGLGFLFNFAQLALLLWMAVALLDWLFLFSRSKPVDARREMADLLSNSDQNPVRLVISNHYPFAIKTRIIDELPVQLQQRSFSLFANLQPGEETSLLYQVRPTQRGEYVFHDIQVFVKSPLGLVVRRTTIKAEKMVKVMPSYLTLRNFELLAHSHRLMETGNKKIRKLGHSLEFEQIKEYVRGDDIRSVNWKATGRKGGQLMINSYTDERSQQVYCILDKGRVMKMPFNGLTLLDYAINAALVLSRVALLKQDKAGLITFSNQLGTFLPADNKSIQMTSILDALYNQDTRFLESDYEKLYAHVRTRLTQRSLIILFTNFESFSALKRQLPYIRAIARNHLLLVVFFENTELELATSVAVQDIEELYTKTIAEKFVYEKRLIVKELQQHGIASILTAPHQLSVNTVNKYLEIKARQAI